MIPQEVLDVHDKRGGTKPGFIVTYNGHFTDGFDFADGVVHMLYDEGHDCIEIKDCDPSNFEIYKRVTP